MPDELDLDRMKTDAQSAAVHPTWGTAYAKDVPALVEEVRRLRQENHRMREHVATIRDYARSNMDDLRSRVIAHCEAILRS